MILSRFRYLLCVLLLLACSPDYIVESVDDVVSMSVVDIISLKSLYQGSCELITQSIVVEGIIVANDMMGEFGDQIFIEDSTGGVAVACEVDYLDFGYGSYVRVICSGLWISNYGGKIEIGARPSSGDSVDVIDEDNVDLYLVAMGDSSEPTPRSRTISELSAADIATLVAIKGLTFIIEDGAEQFCDRDIDTGRAVTTYRTAIDSEGHEIRLLFLYSCDYADVALPTQSVDLCAVVDYISGEFILRVVNYQIFW